LDDGFQHRRLARDLDIVLLDALEPFGFDHVFPRGTLREPVAGLRRAHIVGLSRADTISAEERAAIRRRVAEVAPHAAWCELAHAASGLVNAAGQSQPLDALAGRRVAAFCGIGNPAGFRHTLAATGCEIVAWLPFPDHHAYTEADLARLRNVAADSRAEVLVCTQKDLVKLREPQFDGVALWAVTIEMQFLTGQELFEAKVAGTLRVP
jgi:tetraacyldisaccharide 4'-kinase